MIQELFDYLEALLDDCLYWLVFATKCMAVGFFLGILVALYHIWRMS